MEFCTFGQAAFDPERSTMVCGVLESDAPAHLKEWIRKQLNEGRVIRPSSDDPRRERLRQKVPDPERKTLSAIENSLTCWLERLRPDLPTETQLPTSVRLAGLAQGDFANLDTNAHDASGAKENRLHINQRHWLVRQCISRKLDPESLAWLLLAAYAYINEAREKVTNQHEQEFQQKVFKALLTDQLGQDLTGLPRSRR